MDQCVIGINGGWVGSVAPGSTGTGAAALGGKEGILGIGVPLALSLAGGSLCMIAAALLGARSRFLTISRFMRSLVGIGLMRFG